MRQPFNVNSIAQVAATAALDDTAFVAMCREENERGRRELCEGLEALGFETIGGEANFVLTRVGNGKQCFEALQQRGIIVRPLGPYGLPDYVRITIGKSGENKRLLAAMRAIHSADESVVCT